MWGQPFFWLNRCSLPRPSRPSCKEAFAALFQRSPGCRSPAPAGLLDGYDTALTIGVGIIRADHAVQAFGDVGDQHLIVQHHAFLRIDVVLEYGVAVGTISEVQSPSATVGCCR